MVLILASASVFSVMHFIIENPDVNKFLYRFCFGVVVGILYVGTENIWTAVGFHTGWNFIVLSISDADWRLGDILKLTGLNGDREEVANIAVLGIAALIFYTLYPLKNHL